MIAGKSIIEKVAYYHGVTVNEVSEEIASAIRLAMEDSSPSAQAFWQLVPREGDVPTPEDVIICLAKQLIAQSEDIQTQEPVNYRFAQV